MNTETYSTEEETYEEQIDLLLDVIENILFADECGQGKSFETAMNDAKTIIQRYGRGGLLS